MIARALPDRRPAATTPLWEMELHDEAAGGAVLVAWPYHTLVRYDQDSECLVLARHHECMHTSRGAARDGLGSCRRTHSTLAGR